MVIQGMIVGKDKNGRELRCGDICEFKVKFEGGSFVRKKERDLLKSMTGIIVYDRDSYAFAFETLDNYAPILLMHVVEYGSIEYAVSISDNYGFIVRCGDGGTRTVAYCDDTTASRWHRIYKNNLQEIV